MPIDTGVESVLAQVAALLMPPWADIEVPADAGAGLDGPAVTAAIAFQKDPARLPGSPAVATSAHDRAGPSGPVRFLGAPG